MTRFQRILLRIACALVPPLRRLLSLSGPTIDNLSVEIQTLRAMNSGRRDLALRERAELVEAYAMAQGPWMNQGRGASVAIQESARPVDVSLKERLAELELALEDRGWKRQLAIAETEFSRYGIQQIILISRLYRIKNPLIQRGILVSGYYVFGRGVQVSSDDPKATEVLQDFFTDPRNTPEIGHTALVEKDAALYTDGNIFWCFFTSPDDGKVIIRHIDALEIEEVITDPDDAAVPWFYRRRWTSHAFDPEQGTTTPKAEECWYVSLRYSQDPKAKIPKTIKNKPVIKDVPILHRKTGGIPKWHFGCPRVYAALDWARAYRHLLEDWCSITQALARFSWIVETQGGPAAIASFKQTLATTLGDDGTSIESNPPAVTGSAFISGPGNKLTPVKSAGMTDSPEQGRRVAHQVYCVFGLPETFFADVSVGTLATATSLDRPTQLKFLKDQEAWGEDLTTIGQYVLDNSSMAPKGKLREASANGNGKTHKVTVAWPSILEGDIPARVAAIVEAMGLNGFECTGIDERVGVGLLLTELGVEDVETVLDAMYPEDGAKPTVPPGGKAPKVLAYDPNRTKEELAPPLPAIPPPNDPNAPTGGANQPQPPTQNPANQQGAPPLAPAPRKPRGKRVGVAESDLTAAAIAELRRAAMKLGKRG